MPTPLFTPYFFAKTLPGRVRLLLLLLLLGAGSRAYALQGFPGAHDPSTIIKEGNKYWVFATGQGIYNLYSTDLVNWTPSPRVVFVNNAYPSWINAKVPGFAGNFWAPECIFMNGKYYLYYSCSTFGSQVSAIGLATNVTLDPTNANYKWEDQGEVVSSTTGSGPNAIDPAVLRDASGNVWLTYGSYFGGIRTTQLNTTTGKPLSSTGYTLANGGVEAADLVQHDNFYYLFINRGSCCQGVNSTYYIQVGRAATPMGPFLDKDGKDLNNLGGSTVLSSAGRYIGPGHAGIFTENGVSYFSHHYYDGYDNGAPKLGLDKLTWDAAGWPVVSRDWVPTGRYTVQSQSSNLVWDAWGCTGVSGQMVAQGTPAGLTCQQWDFAPLGNGEYKITNALGGLAVDVIDCSAALGAKLQLFAYNGLNCQRYAIDRASDGTLVFASANGNRVIEVPNASTMAGQQLGLWDYNGCPCQHWTLNAVGTTTATLPSQLLTGVSIYPVPAERGHFTVSLGAAKRSAAATVLVYDLQGREVYHQQLGTQQSLLTVDAGLRAGMYLVQVRESGKLFTQKITVQ